MKLFDVIVEEYELRRAAAKQLLNLGHEESELGRIFRNLRNHDEVAQRSESQYEYDEYSAAIRERRLSSYSTGVTYFKQYKDYDVISQEVTRKRIRPSDKNDQTVVVITLKYGDDITTLWWLPKRNVLTFSREEGDNIDD